MAKDKGHAECVRALQAKEGGGASASGSAPDPTPSSERGGSSSLAEQKAVGDGAVGEGGGAGPSSDAATPAAASGSEVQPKASRHASVVAQLKAGGAAVGGAAGDWSVEKEEELLARRVSCERVCTRQFLAIDNHVEVVSKFLPASISSKMATIKVRNTAEGLGPDVLRALQRQSPSGKLYQRWSVEYAGEHEEGVDEGGLLIDLFSKAFPHLRAAQGTRRLFEAPTPDEEVEVLLPLADADWEAAFPRGVPLEPPSAGAAASSSGSSGGGGGVGPSCTGVSGGEGSGGGAEARDRCAAMRQEAVTLQRAAAQKSDKLRRPRISLYPKRDQRMETRKAPLEERA
mmetsp:Transcript_26945/g.88458  ORF Transcript_26945/g.88458 Transcript_26945/m.88458 type:complete len:344 (+) Transcript_26945:1-1032(+)